jgi:hypothetical protein
MNGGVGILGNAFFNIFHVDESIYGRLPYPAFRGAGVRFPDVFVDFINKRIQKHLYFLFNYQFICPRYVELVYFADEDLTDLLFPFADVEQAVFHMVELGIIGYFILDGNRM